MSDARNAQQGASSMKTITVTITECKTNGRSWTRDVRAEDNHDALRIAVKREWGRRAFFWADSGLGFGRGQVMEDLGNGAGATARTDRVRAEFDRYARIHTASTGRYHVTDDSLDHLDESGPGYLTVAAAKQAARRAGFDRAIVSHTGRCYIL